MNTTLFLVILSGIVIGFSTTMFAASLAITHAARKFVKGIN